jgi:hypothetical protein
MRILLDNESNKLFISVWNFFCPFALHLNENIVMDFLKHC